MLLLGPPGSDAEAILQNLRAGWSCNDRDYDAAKATVLELYKRYLRSELPDTVLPIDCYSNNNTTRVLAACLDSITRQ